jgi:hypothetical protein
MSETLHAETLRNVELADLAATLRSQRMRALDVVVPARRLRFQGGMAVVEGMDPVLEEDGVSEANGLYLPTVVGDEGVADKLGIPLTYVRKLRDGHLGAYDFNVNYWLAQQGSKREFLLRLLRRDTSDAIPGVDDALPHGRLRALLSSQYRTIDNLDVALAVLAGVEAAGVRRPQVQADLTDSRMYLRVTSPEISATALELVRNYRDPSTGRTGREYPLAFAGFVASNSEVGKGGFNLTPRVVLQVCTNGQTITKDAEKTVHIGSKLESGTVQWSEATQQANLKLISSKTTDAVRAFLSREYVQAKVAQLAADAGIVIEQPAKVIEAVSKRVGFTAGQADAILAAFIDGADRTAGGVMHAITYVAQQQPDGDSAADMEDKAVPALAMAASIRL